MDNRPTCSPLVRALEERAFNAWPAHQTLVMDGWLLRFADGYTKRANSINAWQPSAPLEAILDHAAPLYAARGLPIVVRLSPLASGADDAALARRGFARLDETIVMTARLSRPFHDFSPNVFVDPAPSPAWLEGFARANGVPDARRAVHDRIVSTIPSPVAFARLELDATPVAWGIAACERGIAGLFDIVTAPEARRKGAGRCLVEGLLNWAAARGAASAYLQVAVNNSAAIALYRALGFDEAYRYHYRIAGA